MGVNFCSMLEVCEVLGHDPVFHNWHPASMIAGHEERLVVCNRCNRQKYESRQTFFERAVGNYDKSKWH